MVELSPYCPRKRGTLGFRFGSRFRVPRLIHKIRDLSFVSNGSPSQGKLTKEDYSKAFHQSFLKVLKEGEGLL